MPCEAQVITINLPLPIPRLTFCEAFGGPLAETAEAFPLDHLRVDVALGVGSRQFLLGAMGTHFGFF